MLTGPTQEYLDDALLAFSSQQRSYLQATAEYAVFLHKDQSPRPSGEAYGNHVVRVAARIVNEFGIVDEELFIAGLLHDAVEDQTKNLTDSETAGREEAYEVLTLTYSKRVSDAVRGLSNTEEYESTKDREQRNKLYIEHVIHECDANTDCFIVKLSDFFDNAMQLQLDSKPEDRVRGAKKYLPLFDYFADNLLSKRPLPIATRIRRDLANRIKAQQEYINSLLSVRH